MNRDPAFLLTTEAQIDELYGKPAIASVKKEVDYLPPVYQEMIKASPFAVLATAGPEGLDASPRGDGPGFVDIEDEKTLLLPDRRGNNRADSLRNITHDPRVGLLFFIPGVAETLRVNGTAVISIEPELRFQMNGKAPRSVLVIQVEAVFFQCARAIVRSHLWDSKYQRDRSSLPTAGQILEALSNCEIEAAPYDRDLPRRIAETLY
jgi:uncharacterized protein